MIDRIPSDPSERKRLRGSSAARVRTNCVAIYAAMLACAWAIPAIGQAGGPSGFVPPISRSANFMQRELWIVMEPGRLVPNDITVPGGAYQINLINRFIQINPQWTISGPFGDNGSPTLPFFDKIGDYTLRVANNPLWVCTIHVSSSVTGPSFPGAPPIILHPDGVGGTPSRTISGTKIDETVTFEIELQLPFDGRTGTLVIQNCIAYGYGGPPPRPVIPCAYTPPLTAAGSGPGLLEAVATFNNAYNALVYMTVVVFDQYGRQSNVAHAEFCDCPSAAPQRIGPRPPQSIRTPKRPSRIVALPKDR